MKILRELYTEICDKISDITEVDVNTIIKSRLEVMIDIRVALFHILFREGLMIKDIAHFTGHSIQIVSRTLNLYETRKKKYAVKQIIYRFDLLNKAEITTKV